MKIKWKKILQFKWFKRLYMLYIFGFVLHFRPALPFFYDFLKTDKSFVENDITEEILPILFYSTTLLLVPVFFLMEVIRYNPFIIISTLTGIAATCMYIWTDTLVEMQAAQAFYGCATAAEVAYYVSIYAHGEKETYQRLTSHVRAAPLAGKMMATFLSQILVSVGYVSYKELHYFNFAAFILATILIIFLPPIDLKIELDKVYQNPTKFTAICSNLSQIFPNKFVVKWSIWSILTICGYNQLIIYVQPLWLFVQTTNNTFAYNGVLEGLYMLSALTGTILGGYAQFDWKFKGDLLLSMSSLVEAFMLLFMSQITNVVLHCMFYIFLGFMYHFIMTVLCSEIAKFLKIGCFGLVFGLISLLGWALSSGMVCFLNEKVGLHIVNYQDLFMIYGFYHLGISILYIIVGLSYWFAKHTYQ